MGDILNKDIAPMIADLGFSIDEVDALIKVVETLITLCTDERFPGLYQELSTILDKCNEFKRQNKKEL
jgi:hypothetical protein